MTDERKSTDEPDDSEERDPKLGREEVKDLTPPDEAAEDVHGGRRQASFPPCQ